MEPRPSHHERTAGFTPLETVVVMTLVAIGVLGLARMQFAAGRVHTASKTTSTANILASDRLEEMLYGPSFDTITHTNYPNEAYGHVAGGDARYKDFQRAVTVQDSLDVAGRVAVKTVTVQVTWKALRGDRHVEMRSRVARF